MLRITATRRAASLVGNNYKRYIASAVAKENKKVFKIPEKLDDFGSYERASFETLISEQEATLSPPLLTLHARLELPLEYKLSTLARALLCRNKVNENKMADNYGLNIFGKNLLVYHVTEYLMVNYPRLPVEILNAAVHGYMGKFTLLDVAKSWGIEEESKDEIELMLRDEPKEYSLGKLKYQPLNTIPESGVVQYSKNSQGIDRASAYSHAVCSIIAGLYAHAGAEKTKEFIHTHILSRKLDIASMFEFKDPGRELSVLLSREGMSPPVARLIAETGVASNSPVCIVGVFSGEEKLGEGQGASLREAKIRASVQALKSYYLYRPLDATLPSDDVKGDYQPSFIDKGQVVV